MKKVTLIMIKVNSKYNVVEFSLITTYNYI